MAGTFAFVGSPDDVRPMSFTIRARSAALPAFLRERQVSIEGEVDVEGFADHRYLRGILGLDLLRSRELPYEFAFTANDGEGYRFEGKTSLASGAFIESMTVLSGVVCTANRKEIGRALLRFDLRSDLVRFVTSFKTVR